MIVIPKIIQIVVIVIFFIVYFWTAKILWKNMDEWWPLKVVSEIMWFFTVLMVALIVAAVFFVFIYYASLWYKYFKIYFF